MEVTLLLIKQVLSALQNGNIPACIIGEIALNYYNVPRVVHDLEICVPEAALSEAVSILCSTRRFRLVENAAYDLFTEYKRGFPTLMAPSTSLLVVLFPDSYFYLLPLRQSIVPFQERLSTTYSRQLLDLFPGDEIRHLPVPYLAAFFIGLCRRFFESNDYMARIAAEQLVDGMDLDEEWVESNLSGAAPEVRELAAQLVAEKSSRYDGYLDFEAPCPSVEDGKMKGVKSIPGSGFS